MKYIDLYCIADYLEIANFGKFNGRNVLRDRTFGYTYCRHVKELRTGVLKQYWRCIEYKKQNCLARAITKDHTVTRWYGEHNHSPTLTTPFWKIVNCIEYIRLRFDPEIYFIGLEESHCTQCNQRVVREEAYYVQNQRGRRYLKDRTYGFVYFKHVSRTKMNGDVKTYWKCAQSNLLKCSARAVTVNENMVSLWSGQHNHPPEVHSEVKK